MSGNLLYKKARNIVIWKEGKKEESDVNQMKAGRNIAIWQEGTKE